MELCSIADCYIHYGKLGKKTIDAHAKKHLNVFKIKISFILLKENKICIFLEVAECRSMQFLFSYCNRMWILKITVSYCKFTIKLTRAVKPVSSSETW